MWEAVCGNLKHLCYIVVGKIGNGIKEMKPEVSSSNLLPPVTEHYLFFVRKNEKINFKIPQRDVQNQIN